MTITDLDTLDRGINDRGDGVGSAGGRVAELHAEHAPSLMRFVIRYVGEWHTAEDIVQETMLRAWRHIDSVPVGQDDARRWLFAVARRLTIDVARMRKIRPSEVGLSDLVDPADPGQDTAGTAVAAQVLPLAIRELSPDHRIVLSELYGAGRTASEAAERLEIPVGTVKSRAYYAIRVLRSALLGEQHRAGGAAR